MKNKEKLKPIPLQAKDAKAIIKGPEPERLKIEQPFEQAIDHVLKIKRPKKGWPK